MDSLAELRTEIRLWSERNDLSDDQVDRFINLVEQNFKKDFFLPPNEKIVMLTTDAEGKINIPYDYLKTKHMYVLDSDGKKKVLYRKPNDFVTTASDITDSGSLAYFERSGGSYIFAPYAGEGVDVYITYYSLIPSLLDIEVVEPGAINFVLAIMPTVYLFGALMFLNMFIMNEQRANYYGNLYDIAKSDLIAMQEQAEMSGSSLHVVPTLSDDGRLW